MLKIILVCTDESRYSDTATDYALDLTRRLSGRLLGLHVLDSRVLEGPLMADISNWVGAQPYGGQVVNFTELLRNKGQSVVKALEDKCRERGVAAQIELKYGHPAQAILDAEARAELLVIGKKGEHSELLSEMMGSITERIARRTEKPCLVTPDKFRPIARILAAFDGSSHASKALHEAVELAQGLKAALCIVTVADEETPKRAELLLAEAATLVKSHDCEAETLIQKGPAAVGILEAAQTRQCDLIMMGAYGHSRIREMILGSNTNHVVMHSDLPVMLVR